MIVRNRHGLGASIHALLGALLATMPVVAGDAANALLGLPAIVVPADNPITPAKVALGKKLFMDRRLSINNTLSCAMCHVPEQGFTQNELATSVGFQGKSLRRNAPSLLNVALHDSFQRDGAQPTLEQQLWGPLLAANEMANPSPEALVTRIKALPDYAGLFAAAFAGREPSKDSIGQAIASFERTLLAGGSRFDRWYFGGVKNALSVEEQAGFAVFVRANCQHCHRFDQDAAPFTDNRFHNTGLRGVKKNQSAQPISVRLAPGVRVLIDAKDLSNVSEAEAVDDGRFEVTGNANDRDAFKTPSLRNVALTAPYMHDGSLATLADVVDFYASGCAAGQPVSWSVQEKRQLIAFLASLTGASALDLGREARAAFVNN